MKDRFLMMGSCDNHSVQTQHLQITHRVVNWPVFNYWGSKFCTSENMRIKIIPTNRQGC